MLLGQKNVIFLLFLLKINPTHLKSVRDVQCSVANGIHLYIYIYIYINIINRTIWICVYVCMCVCVCVYVCMYVCMYVYMWTKIQTKSWFAKRRIEFGVWFLACSMGQGSSTYLSPIFFSARTPRYLNMAVSVKFRLKIAVGAEKCVKKNDFY